MFYPAVEITLYRCSGFINICQRLCYVQILSIYLQCFVFDNYFHFRNKKVTYFDFFTHMYLIPVLLLLLLHPFSPHSLSLCEMCSLSHALWFIAHTILTFLSPQTLHLSCIFNTNSLTFFSWWYFQIPSLTCSSIYNIEIVLLGWKMKSCALISHLAYKHFPLSPEPQCWAIYAVLIPRRKNYCLTAIPRPLLASKVELGFR